MFARLPPPTINSNGLHGRLLRNRSNGGSCRRRGRARGRCDPAGTANAARALHEFTAVLPAVEPGFPDLPYGRNTSEAIQTGVCRGLAGAVRNLVEGYSTHLNRWPQVIATGGDAAFMAPHCDFLDKLVADLTLRGVGGRLQQAPRRSGSMNLPFKTICTVLTPPGAGGIALLRVDGPKTISIVQSVFRPRSGRGVTLAATNRVRYGALVIDGETIDEVLLTVIPTSQTHAVEIACHGGVRVIERVLVALIGLGAEFVEGDATLELAWPADTMIEPRGAGCTLPCTNVAVGPFRGPTADGAGTRVNVHRRGLRRQSGRAASRIDALIATRHRPCT